MAWVAIVAVLGSLLAFGIIARRAYQRGQLSGKTLWDWLDLLFVPLALVLVGAWLSFAADSRQAEREEQRVVSERRAAERRERADQRLQSDQSRSAILQRYLDDMSELILDRSLTSSRPRATVRALARTLTLTALRRLDGPRRGLVIRFLWDTGLIHDGNPVHLDHPVVNLKGADLRHADLRRATLVTDDPSREGLPERGPALDGVDLRHADFRDSNIDTATFAHANLESARFDGAHLDAVSFRRAYLAKASFRSAYITSKVGYGSSEVHRTNFTEACIDHASFASVTMVDVDFDFLSGRKVNFTGADFDSVASVDVFLPDSIFRDAQVPTAVLSWKRPGSSAENQGVQVYCKSVLDLIRRHPDEVSR